ncbi:MAG: hypothetical protein KF901_34655 [Myxococcales bacterium]|nr:hypothetical protein [Myxococcales bacterium]
MRTRVALAFAILGAASVVGCARDARPSPRARAAEAEVDEVLRGAAHERVGEWRRVELDETHLALVDVELPREGCRVLVVIAEGDQAQVQVRRGAVTTSSIAGRTWWSICADEADALRSFATRVEAHAPSSDVVHVGVFRGPDRGGAAELDAYYRPAAPPPIVAAPMASPAPQVATMAPTEPTAARSPAPQVAPPPCTPTPRDAARAAYDEGRAAVAAEDLRRAADAFERAFACSPDGTILFNLAAVLARLGEVQKATAYYEQLQTEYASGLDGARARQVEAALVALRAPGRLRIAPRGAIVTVDGVRVRGREVEVEPGERVVVWRRGARSQTATVRVGPGQTIRVDPPEGAR